MVLPFEGGGLNNIVDGSELVPDWLSGASNREEAKNTLITLCHRFEIEGAMILTSEFEEKSSNWCIRLSSYATSEFNGIRNCPDVRFILQEKLTSNHFGMATAGICLPSGDRRMLFMKITATDAQPAVFVFMSKDCIQFSKLAELRLAAEIIWRMMRNFDRESTEEKEASQPSQGSRIEQQVLELQRRGCNSKEICDHLGLSPHTIFHLLQYTAKKYKLN